MESGYTAEILIDCNRINSEEKKGGNTSSPAIFTNKVGSGLKLNVGDKVSVHGGFVSERGAGGDVIELTGKKKDYTYTLKESVVSLFQPRYAMTLDGDAHTGRMGELQPYNHHCSVITPTERTYTLQDNKGHLQINYYKTTNGEGYFHLPRRYDAHKAPYDENPIDLWRNSVTAPAGPAPDGKYPYADGIPSIPYWYSLYNSNTANQQSNGYKCDRYANGRVMTNWAYDYSRCLDDIEYYNLPGIDEYDGVPKAGSSRIYKKKNDNSRYTLFTKEISYWAEWRCVGKFVGDPTFTEAGAMGDVELNKTASRDDYAEHGNLSHGRDPALSGYVRYNEIKEINIDTLHSAPENIASTITNQLNSVVSDKPIRGEVGGTFQTGEGTPGEPLTKYVGRETRNTFDYYSLTDDGQQSLKGIDIGRKVESECFKTFPCANARTFDKHHYQAFWQDSSGDPDQFGMGRNAAGLQDKVQNYLSAYSTIGVKRADLFEVGREVAAMSPGNNAGVAINGVGEEPKYSWRDVWHPWIMNGAVTDIPQTPTSTDILGSTRATTDVILSYEWNDDNLKLLKRYFDTQAKYPELWTGYNGGNAGENDSIIKKEGLLNTNSRFWHMNPVDGSSSDTNNQLNSLGNDNYENGQGTTPTTGTFTNKQSLPLFFYYDETRDNIASGGNNDNELYYGMFIKRRAHFPTDANQYDCIGVTTKKVGGVPDYFWGQGADIDSSPPVPGAADAIGHSFTRTIGVDIHFNAYGTDAICLYSGLLDATPLNTDPGVDASGIPEINRSPNEFPNQVYYAHDEASPQETMDQGWYQTSTQIRERYCGANQIEMNFDTSASRFNFQLLHTPENIGNPVQAGFPASTTGGDAVAELEGAKNPVIKVNKRLFPHEFCPDMIPYTSTFGAKFHTNNKAGEVRAGASDGEGENIQEPYNSNMSLWGIYDADSGIFIDDFGITDETMWNDSLWGILGFSYAQFNSSTTLNRQTRITDSVVQDNIGAITTNANMDAGEAINLVANINGVPMFSSTIGTQLACNFQNQAPGWGHMPPNREIPPAITIDASNNSAQVNAANLPRKMLRPYFLVRSNLIGDVSYLGGNDSGQGLPIIYVVNKENGFGDFYFQGESSTEFTITKEKTITSITTSIHDADFSLAPVDENSAIIYKITKQVNANMNVAQEVMKTLGKK
jgi:hypothetical protein